MAHRPDGGWHRCPDCGAEVSATEQYCPACGAPQELSDGAGQAPRQPQSTDDGWSTGAKIAIAIGLGLLSIPVIVVLAAVIGAFVLGMGDVNEAAPQNSFDYDYEPTNDTLHVEMVRGDAFDSDQVRFVGDIEENRQTWTEVSGEQQTVKSTDSVTLHTQTDEFLVELVWESEDGENSVILSTRTGPNRPSP